MNYKALVLGAVLTATGCGNWDKAFDGTIGNERVTSHNVLYLGSRTVSVFTKDEYDKPIRIDYFDRCDDDSLDDVSITDLERNTIYDSAKRIKPSDFYRKKFDSYKKELKRLKQL